MGHPPPPPSLCPPTLTRASMSGDESMYSTRSIPARPPPSLLMTEAATHKGRAGQGRVKEGQGAGHKAGGRAQGREQAGKFKLALP